MLDGISEISGLVPPITESFGDVAYINSTDTEGCDSNGCNASGCDSKGCDGCS